jgi:hypothetical protein
MSEAERKRNSLREQLSRAKGALANSLGISAAARANKRAAAESKQRLSDVLWNDRTLAASQTVAADRSAAQQAPVTPVAATAPQARAPITPPPPAQQLPASFAAPPVQLPAPASSGAARARVATPTPTPTSKRPAVPAGAFAPPRQRRPSPPQPSAAGTSAPVPASVLSDLESLIAADERFTSPASAPRTQPPTPPPARKPPPIPPRASAAPPPSAADGAASAAAAQPAGSDVAVPSVEVATPSVEPAAPSVEVAAEPPAVAAAADAEDEDEDSGWQEPICTRSMARLLAGQGHRDRALAIYEVLLRTDAADASLRAEADALRVAR